MKSIKTPDYTWIYMENPDTDDLERLQKIFNLHPVVLGEFNSPTYRPQVNTYKNYTFMVLHFPIYNEEEETTEMGEVDILINKDYLVTNCTKHQQPLARYFSRTEKQQRDNPTAKMPGNPYLLLLRAIDLMLSDCFPKLDHIANKLEAIEKDIFKGQARGMVKRISVVKRDILNMRRILQPQRSILESLANRENFRENGEFRIRINDIIGNHVRVWSGLESHKETIDSLEATNDSLSTYRLNRIMKMLTIFSVIFLPATLTAGLFGMNLPLPTNDFWLVLMIVLELMLGFFLFMKLRRWI